LPDPILHFIVQERPASYSSKGRGNRKLVLLERFEFSQQLPQSPENKAFGTALMMSGVPILWTTLIAATP
jgi:hypothetical protein